MNSLISGKGYKSQISIEQILELESASSIKRECLAVRAKMINSNKLKGVQYKFTRNGGEGGIRTLGTSFEVHTLSRRAHSTTLAPLRVKYSVTRKLASQEYMGLAIYFQYHVDTFW